MKPSFSPRSAFSLIEILTVIVIVAVIASFAIPGAAKMIRGTDVTRGSQIVTDQLAAARQQAIARNKQVEIRFLRYADPETPGESVAEQSTWKIRGIQLMEVAGSGIPVPLAPMQRLPGAMILNEGKYSSLFDSSGEGGQTPLTFKNPTALDPLVPRLPRDQGRSYTYASFRFFPDGSTSLPPKGNWHLTLHDAAARLTDPLEGVSYFTLQVDPVSGATRSYRPELAGS